MSQRLGGQQSPSIGDSTTHHRDPYDFSIGLRNAAEQADRLAGFEAERKQLSNQQEPSPF